MTIHTHINELSQTEADELRSLVNHLRALPEQDASPELHAQTMALLQKTQRVVLWRNPWVRIAAAASIAILLSAAYVLSSRPQPLSSDHQWLVSQQEEDGTWDPARHGGTELFRPALTALSILALDKSSATCSDTINKGIAALARLQTKDGLFESPDAQAQAYNLAMTTFALARCTPHTPTARPIVMRAVEAIKASQLPNGSWDYAPTPEGNIAITSWMVRALKSAEESGAGDSQAAQRKGLRWLMRTTTSQNGYVSYKPTERASDTLTALTAISFITAGKSFADVQTCAHQMTERLAQQTRSESQRDCYRDYAKIVALELDGKPAEALRIRQAMKSLSINPDTWQLAGGELYTVAFTALCK
ncbi:MAG: prenyltransferase/squalene oxidase repeat-containing protein [bacterium]